MFDTATKKKVESWLRRMLYGTPDSVPDRIVLSTVTSLKKSGTELHCILFPEKGQTSAEEIEGWISEIEQIAYDDCEDLGGVQRYALLPYYGKAQRNRLIFRMAGEEKDDDAFDSEPANKIGLIAQLMRHNEAIMRSSLGATNNVINQYARTVATLASQNEALNAKHVESMVLMEDLTVQKHERQLQNRREDFQLGMKQEIFKDGKTLLPLVVNRLVGKKVLPENVDAKTMAMKGLMESLRPEQIGKVAQQLNPAQQVAFLEFYEMFRGEPEKSKEEPEEKSTNGASRASE